MKKGILTVERRYANEKEDLDAVERRYCTARAGPYVTSYRYLYVRTKQASLYQWADQESKKPIFCSKLRGK